MLWWQGLDFLWDLSKQLSQCPISYGAAERPPFEWCDSKGYSDYGSVTGGGHCSSKLPPLIDMKFTLCSVRRIVSKKIK